ncbi:MAG: hypothetical protein LBC07_06085, partial [Elusimicrobiota bacterium]|nr:hypothetical protein [Elusimicrobiota bacterium]
MFIIKTNAAVDTWNSFSSREIIIANWDDFISQYKNPNNVGAILTLSQNISPSALPLDIGAGADNLTINGAKFSLDANNTSAGGFSFTNSIVKFENISILNFTKKPISLIESAITFMDAITINNTFIDTYHYSGIAGAAVGGINSLIYFFNVSASFINNQFSQPWNHPSGGAIGLDASKLFISNSTITFQNNIADTGGAIAIINKGSEAEITNSFIIFKENKASLSQTNTSFGGALLLHSVNLIFKNSTLIFLQNYSPISTLNDIVFSSIDSQITFYGNNQILSPIFSKEYQNGYGSFVKTGNGILSISSAPQIENDFIIQQGTVIFLSDAKNSGLIKNLSVLSGASISLSNSLATAGDFTITNDFNLTGILHIDANFAAEESDFISVGGNFTVANSTLSINDLNPMTNKKLTILKSNNIPIIKNHLFAPRGYALTVDENTKSILLSILGEWNLFAQSFANAPNHASVLLIVNAQSAFEAFPLPLGNPSSNNLTVNGGDHFLDSQNSTDLGFALENISATFKNISFYSFSANQSSAAVFVSHNSAITFTSSVTFSSNTSFSQSNKSAGAFFADRSTLNFIKANVIFSSNVNINLTPLVAGGAIVGHDASRIYFTNSAAVFIDNASGADGAAFYLEASNLFFNFSSISFINNSAVETGGAIAANSGEIYFANSKINFSSQSASAGGAISLKNSTAAFFKSTISFSQNSALTKTIDQGGGALQADYSTISFTNSSIIFSSNITNGNGGAVIANRTNLSFTNSKIIASFNSGSTYESLGGAFSFNSSTLLFENANAEFLNNNTQNSGGAIYLNNSSAVFRNSAVSFKSNLALNLMQMPQNTGGGAIFANYSSITFINS